MTGVFFNVTGNPLLTTISALSGGTTYAGTTPVSAAGANVGGEWGYLHSLSQYGANSGISSSGLGVFGFANFNGPELFGPSNGALAGLQYGIASAGDTLAHVNGNGNPMNDPLTHQSVIFLLSGIGSLSNISNITFQYGTALSEGHFSGGCVTGCGSVVVTGVPEPTVVALFGLGMLGLGLARRRRS